ncbi:hypothetical protein ACFQ1M_07335 [Sungkyunkwania multivorans]|uniref:Uncharacterized protein n=1 Tax=Sungkyunkwania multivorans TaxID=1173618 RepID=A0ABW3CWW8_9FLAO
MAFKVHKVTKYNYSYSANTGRPSRLQLWGASGNIAQIRFVDDAAAVPAPVISADLNKATAYFKDKSQQGIIDMLRNEDPVSVTINNGGAGFVFIHTGIEPVGEGE